MHALENVIWQALSTRQAEFAEVVGLPRRFVPEVTSLTAFAEPNAEGYASLAGLVGSSGTAAVFLDFPFREREGWKAIGGAPLLEMVCDNGGGVSANPAGSDDGTDAAHPQSRGNTIPSRARGQRARGADLREIRISSTGAAALCAVAEGLEGQPLHATNFYLANFGSNRRSFMIPSRSNSLHSSVILPFTIRQIVMPRASICFPVAGRPLPSPVLVPVPV